MGAHLVNHVDLMTRLGHLEDADRDVDELERLAAQIPVLNMFSISMRTGLQLDMGLWTDAEKGCVVLEAILDMFEEPPPSLFLWVMRIRGELELASGRIENACTAFERAERVAVAAGVMEPNVAFWWVPSIDAYRDSGRFGDLERIVCWLEEMTADSTNRWPTAAAMAGRAMLSEEAGSDATAGALFDEATTCMGAVPMPLERARLLTWQGAFLRRQGDLRSARRTLIKAFQLADSRGAGLVANQARSELRAAGGRLRRTTPKVGGLTQRESQVAEIASSGHTTSEIALQLGIATKTVEHHLESVYRKLGIKSRRELMRKRFSGDLDLSQAILPAPADQDDSDGENS